MAHRLKRGEAPLAATARRLATFDEEGARLVFGDPTADRWHDLTTVPNGGLDVLFADAEPHVGGRRDYLGATVASSLANALVTAGWPAVLVDQDAPDPCGDGYCGTCRFRDDDARRARLTRWLEEAATAAG
jgi:ferredoxin